MSLGLTTSQVLQQKALRRLLWQLCLRLLVICCSTHMWPPWRHCSSAAAFPPSHMCRFVSGDENGPLQDEDPLVSGAGATVSHGAGLGGHRSYPSNQLIARSLPSLHPCCMPLSQRCF